MTDTNRHNRLYMTVLAGVCLLLALLFVSLIPLSGGDSAPAVLPFIAPTPTAHALYIN